MSVELQERFSWLEKQRAAVFSRVESLDDERLNRRPEDDGWSAIQVMSHLINSEKASLVAIRKKMDEDGQVPKAGLGSVLKSTALAIFLRTPLRVKAPPRVAEVPDHQDLATTRRLWDEVRSQWKELIDTFPAELAGRAVFRHPVAGDMDMSQALGFMEAHFNRHAKQIDRVLAGGD